MSAHPSFLLMSVLSAVACSRQEAPPERTRSTHEWFTSVNLQGEYAELPSEAWRSVLGDKASEAEALLRNDEWLELDVQAARHLTGRRDAERPGLEPYLLRGVSCSGNREMQKVFQGGSAFWVSHWGMGLPDSAFAAPVVVFTKTPPTALSVSCNFSL